MYKVTLDLVSIKSTPPERVAYSPYGYVIQPDGTTYALVKQYTHGVVLALLYPELAEKYNETAETKLEYEVESIDFLDVRAFQRFELDHNGSTPAIRVGALRYMGPPTIDFPVDACPPEQIEALRNVARQMDLNQSSEVCTNMIDMQLSQALTLATMNREERYAQISKMSEERDEF